MTPEERDALKAIGLYINENIGGSAVQALCTGIFTPIFIMVIHSHVKHIREGDGTTYFWVVVMISTIGLLSMFAYILCHLILEFAFLESLKIRNMLPGQIRHAFNEKGIPFFIAIDWLHFLLPILNDAFIIWRAWAIFGRRPWALYLSITLYLISFGTILTFLGLVAQDPASVLQPVTLSQKILRLLYTWTAFATTFVATSFIGWTLWRHLTHTWSKHKVVLRPASRARIILFILVDSGVIYCILQFIQCLVLFVSNSHYAATIADSVFVEILFIVSLIYPTVTIFLIRGSCSVVEEQSSIIELYAPQGP